MYDKEIITSRNKLRASWANKVESNLKRLGSYLGEVADYAALPDPATKSPNDWYITLDSNQIYINVYSTWEVANRDEVALTRYSIYGLESGYEGYVHGKIYGATFANVLGYSGLNVEDAASKSFTSISDHSYFNCTGTTINSRITGNGASKTITNSTGAAANIIVLDLTQMGALDSARANYYSDIHETTVTDWVDLTNQEIYNEVAGEYFALKSVGFDESGAKKTNINGEILDLELHALNGYCDYLDTTEGKIVKKNYRETVTVTSNAATLSFAAYGDAIVFNSAGLYIGSATGTSLSVTAADGEYTAIYNLASDQSVEVDIRAISLNNNTGVIWDSSSDDSTLERTSMIVIFSELIGSDYYEGEMLPDRKIKSIISCSVFDGQENIDVTEDAEIGSDGYGFTIPDITEDTIVQYEVELDDSCALPALELYVPDTLASAVKTNIDKTNELKGIIATNKRFLDILTKAVKKIGVESESLAISTHETTTFESNNYKQIPDLTIYGQTVLSEIARDKNFNADSDSDNAADYYVFSEELDAEFSDKEQRIHSLDAPATELIYTPDTTGKSGNIFGIENVESNRLADGIGAELELYGWEAGTARWTLSGRTLVNLIYSGKDVPDGEGRYFKCCDGNTYIDMLNETTISGDNTYKLVTNSSGDTADMAVYNLTSMRYLTEKEAARANVLAGEALYDTDTLWEDLPAEIIVEMLYYAPNYTKEYASSITNTRSGAPFSEVNFDLPILSLMSNKNTINSDGTGIKHVWLDDLSGATFTHLYEGTGCDYVQIELDADIAEEIEDFEIGVVWDYSSDVSDLSRDLKDVTVETFWNYSSDVSTLRRQSI